MRESEEGGSRRREEGGGSGIADTGNLRQTFSHFSELMQALSKIVPPLEQRENNKMPVKVWLQRAISD